jgi:ATP-dependent Clp protease ATP-binding subunit ClpB
VDEFIIFEPLRADQMAHIVGLRLKGVVSRLAEKRIRMVGMKGTTNGQCT